MEPRSSSASIHTEGKEAAICPSLVHQQAIWSGFDRKSIKERQELLRWMMPHVFVDAKDSFPFLGLHEDIANQMIENCIG
jgi:hypothetical protein